MCAADGGPQTAASAPPARHLMHRFESNLLKRPQRYGLLVLTVSALLVAAGCSSFSSSADAKRPLVGIGDNGPEMFTDRNFKRLHVKIARVILPWDYYRKQAERDRLASWIANAKSLGIEPLVALERSHTRPRAVPSTAEYGRAVDYLRDNYPKVRTLSAWNEANHKTQPVARRPKLAARYYNIMRKKCAGCKIVAADVLDQDDMVSWITRFRRYAKGNPRIWGLHTYRDTNRALTWQQSATRKMLLAVPGEIWFTEVGGVVALARSFPYSERRAAESVKRTLRLSMKSPRIKRVYLYSWYGTFHESKRPPYKWDSGLVGPDGKPRAGYTVLRKWLGR